MIHDLQLQRRRAALIRALGVASPHPQTLHPFARAAAPTARSYVIAPQHFTAAQPPPAPPPFSPGVPAPAPVGLPAKQGVFASPTNQWGDPWQTGDPFVSPFSGRVQPVPNGNPLFPVLVHAPPRNPSGGIFIT